MLKNGLTLVEILIAAAIVAVLATLILVSASGLKREADVRLTESTIAVITGALQQYHEFWGSYPPEVDTTVVPDWRLAALANAVNRPVDDVDYRAISKASMQNPNWTYVAAAGLPDDDAVPSIVLYLYLSGTPSSQKVVAKLADRMLADELDDVGNPFIVQWAPPLERRRLVRFVDAWHMPLRYEYTAGDQFPVVRSAGPDRTLDTADDIRSSRI